jgi:hypothetical protein
MTVTATSLVSHSASTPICRSLLTGDSTCGSAMQALSRLQAGSYIPNKSKQTLEHQARRK